MKIHQIPGKNKKAKRVGRGIGSGVGKTAGRGTKGQKSRAGHHKLPAGFEGGQMPLILRLPHQRGFRPARPKAVTITTGSLNRFSGTVNLETLRKAGWLKKKSQTAKVVFRGAVTKKLTVKLPATPQAAAAITKAGGTIEPHKSNLKS